jgi:SAM-dependent methyltransferase
VSEAVAPLPLPPHAAILDAGCGSGRNLSELGRFGSVTGLEVSSLSLDAARARGVPNVAAGDLKALPFEPDAFDLATCLDVIEHIEDDRGALRELHRVVKPGGFLLVTVPSYPRLWSSHDIRNGHFRRYTRSSLLAAAAAAGWSPRRTTHFNVLLLPVAAAYRTFERGRDDPPPVSELMLTYRPRWRNALLGWPMRVESVLLARGRRIPAGLSLLAVFQSGSRAGG